MSRARQWIALLALLAVGAVFGGAEIPNEKSLADGQRDFSRWETAIAAFERRDRLNPPPKDAVLFVGSSSIRFWNLAKWFPETKTINRGFGGSHIADSVHFADRIILKHKPRVVVLYAGDNDLAAGKSPEQVFADFRDLAKIVRGALPNTKLVVVSLKPCLLRWRLIDQVRQTNALIEAYCERDDRLVFVDVFHRMLGKNGRPRGELFIFDCLHLNAKGYELWTSLVKLHLK